VRALGAPFSEWPLTTDSIAQGLSLRILNCEINPGANLREVELSHDLGVSRQSLRATLAQLNGGACSATR